MSLWKKHAIFETNSILLVIGVLIVIAIGGLVEITPLFYLKSTIETADGVRPYTPLELAGRNIYVREGCYNCHSQMIRPLRDEVERYGHYSLAAESMYDRPFQWGSKRTGPDLARVGGKYSDDWHRDHLNDPKSVVPGTIMPAYPWLAADRARPPPYRRRSARPGDARRALHAGDDRQRAAPTRSTQAGTDAPDADRADARYPKANVRDFDGKPERITEADALIAYLQIARHARRLPALRRQSQHPLRTIDDVRPIERSPSSLRPGALLYFVLVFVVVLVLRHVAVRQRQFDEAARIPLRED